MTNIIPQSAAKAFDTNYKIGLIGTTDMKGDPHITLISTLKAKGDKQMIFGNFVVGESKKYLLSNPKTGFLVMTLDKDFWTGRMDYTGFLGNGEDHEAYNRTPLFRYNTYFGIDSVYYFDLKNISEGQALDMAGVIANSMLVYAARHMHSKKNAKEGLSPWALNLMQKMDTLCFISWHDKDGYPVIAPCIQLQAADESTLMLSEHPYSDMLKSIEPGARVAVYASNLRFQSVMAKGCFSGFRNGLATINIDRIYNPMPPKHGWLLD